MKANYRQKTRKTKTHAERLNALRDAKEQELIGYGMAIGLRLMAEAVHQSRHIANGRLLHDFALARYLWETHFKFDPEYAAETLFAALDQAMGPGWDEKADALCERWLREGRS